MGPSSADELTMDSGHRWPPLTVHRDCAFFRQRIDQEVRAKHNFVLSARPSTSASEKFQMLQQAPALLRLTVGRGQQRLEHLRAARQQERQPQQQHPFAGGGGTPSECALSPVKTLLIARCSYEDVQAGRCPNEDPGPCVQLPSV